MEILFYTTAFSLLAFMLLATYDGFYLHLWTYRLYAREESKFEHGTHTIRAVLFPLIVVFLLLNQTSFSWFLIGLAFVILDFVVLAVDAYAESESRSFMGGLPRKEYIIHLFSNAFHYGVVIGAITLKLRFLENGFVFVNDLNFSTTGGKVLLFVAENAIPGAILLAILHVLLYFKTSQQFLEGYRNRITCC